MRLKQWGVGLLGLWIVLCAMPVQGYNLLIPEEDSPVCWLPNSVPVFLDVRGVEGSSLDALESILIDAIITWNSVPCSGISLRYVGLVDESPGAGVYLHWVTPSSSGGVLNLDAAGITETYFGASGRIERADMHLNSRFSWTEAGDSFDPTRVDIQAVITHELGHALGLGHSRDREATMFFAGGHSPLRTLGQDDENGLCFLYPSGGIQLGELCDPCLSSTGCKSERCLSFPDGMGAYCATSCGDELSDCPGGYSCTWLPSLGENLCLPSNMNCGEASRGGNVGEYCYGGQTCASALCLPTPRGAYCTEFCDLASLNSCPESMACLPALAETCPPGEQECGLCIRFGDSPLGALCWDSAECASGICLGVPGEPGSCSGPCTNHVETCAEGGLCSLGICSTPGEWPEGAPCSSPFQCKGAVCAPLPSLSGDELICSRNCETSADCSSNTLCANFAVGTQCSAEIPCQRGQCDVDSGICACETDLDCLGGLTCQGEEGDEKMFCSAKLCMPFPKKGRDGELCNEQVGCVTGLNCDWRGGQWGICGIPCDLQEGGALKCAEGHCAWLPAPSAFQGACVVRGDRRNQGELCSIQEPCHADLACVSVEGASSTCYEDCLLDLEGSCTSPLACVDFEEGVFPGRGVCLPEGLENPALISRLALGDDPPPVDYGLSDQRILDGEAYIPIESRVLAEPPEAGCREQSKNPEPGLVFMIFCLMVALRRKDGPRERA